jgi:hypothetical protein
MAPPLACMPGFKMIKIEFGSSRQFCGWYVWRPGRLSGSHGFIGALSGSLCAKPVPGWGMTAQPWRSSLFGARMVWRTPGGKNPRQPYYAAQHAGNQPTNITRKEQHDGISLS